MCARVARVRVARARVPADWMAVPETRPTGLAAVRVADSQARRRGANAWDDANARVRRREVSPARCVARDERCDIEKVAAITTR